MTPRPLLLLVCLLIQASLVNANTVIFCTDNTAGYCTSWEVQTNTGVCFPGDAALMTPKGLTPMKTLKRGDQVLAYIDGKEVFTTLTSWLHKGEEEREYLKVKVEGGDVLVSAKHSVMGSDGQYYFAEEVQELFGVGAVKSVETIKKKGYYSPKTNSNNYFVYVNGSEEHKILAHNYAHIRNPTFYEPILDSIEAVWSFIDPSAALQSIHPAHAWLHHHCTILQQP